MLFRSTIITTEACLPLKGRNNNLTKEEISDYLCQKLGGKKVIWLPRGIYNDETNEHVDNICAFIKPGRVALAWTDNTEDPQYKLSQRAYEVLTKETDACGRNFTIIKIPIPQVPVCITQEEAKGYSYEPGEEKREVGERLAASYVNFYISNNHVLVPQFEDINDAKAIEILQNEFKTRTVVAIQARSIIVGGGNIHCITQQIPEV